MTDILHRVIYVFKFCMILAIFVTLVIIKVNGLCKFGNYVALRHIYNYDQPKKKIVSGWQVTSIFHTQASGKIFLLNFDSSFNLR